MRNVFVSYQRSNPLDRLHKDELIRLNNLHGIFNDYSVDYGDISDDLDDQTIRRIIRDEYLRDSTVTIVLVGTGTRGRKHVDWEVYSSMYDGTINKKSGILVINLPSTDNPEYYTAAHNSTEKQLLYSGNSEWITITDRAEYERRYPYMPERLIDNLVTNTAKMSVTGWNLLMSDLNRLRFLIEATHLDRGGAIYDLSRPMRRRNS